MNEVAGGNEETLKYQKGDYAPQKYVERIRSTVSVLLYSPIWRLGPKKKEMNESGK